MLAISSTHRLRRGQVAMLAILASLAGSQLTRAESPGAPAFPRGSIVPAQVAAVADNAGDLPLGIVSARSTTCGAVGNGTADDSAALQRCIAYAIAHNLSMYLPSGNYLVTKSLDVSSSKYGQGFRIIGNGEHLSIIVHALTEPYPVLDFGGCTYCGTEDIGIVPKGNDPKNSRATAGILSSKGPSGGSYGNGFQLLRTVVDAGSSPTDAAVVFLNTDLSRCDDSTAVGLGSGLVIGESVGKATSVASKFYKLPSAIDATDFHVQRCTVSGELAPPLQLTGSAAYTLNGMYVSLIRSGSGRAIIEISGPGGKSLYGEGSRTENQSTAMGVPAMLFDTSSWGGNFSAVLDSDSSGVSIKGSSPTVNLSQYKIWVNGCLDRGFDFPGFIQNSDIGLGECAKAFGSVGRASGVNIWTTAQSASAVLSSIRSYDDVRVSSRNGETQYSDMSITKSYRAAGKTGLTANVETGRCRLSFTGGIVTAVSDCGEDQRTASGSHPGASPSQVVTGTITTTAAPSDLANVPGARPGDRCFVQATNAVAAKSTGVYIGAVTGNAVQIYHPAAAGATFNVFCVPF